jgi:hypothetical protein
MNDNGRDDLDRALGSGLAGLAPDPGDPDAVLASLRPRLRRARTRHRVARASTLIAALVFLGSAAAVATNRGTTGHVSVAAPKTTTSSRGARTHASTTTASAPRPTTSLPPRGTDSSSTTLRVVAPPASSDRSGPAAHSPSGSTTTVAPTASVHTYSSPGGTLTVRYRPGALTIVSYHATPGYTAEVSSAQPDDIEVRFSDDEHEFQIRVRVDNGKLVREISED